MKLNINRIDNLEQEIELKTVKETVNRKFNNWGKSYMRYCGKYYKHYKQLLNGNIGNNWSDVYSIICEKIPHIVIDYYTNMVLFPDRNGDYKNRFNPKNPSSIYRYQFYVEDNVLKKVYAKNNILRNKKKLPKRKKKVFNPLFKYDYDFEVVTYSRDINKPSKLTKLSYTFQVQFSVQTGMKLNNNGEEIPHITYFGIKDFKDWAERHHKTYRIRYYTSYSCFSKHLDHLESKESYEYNI